MTDLEEGSGITTKKAFQHALTHTHLMYNNAFTVETYGAVCYTNVIINKHYYESIITRFKHRVH